NFLLSSEGALVTAAVGSFVDRIHDGSPNTGWSSSSGSYVNNLDFSFDHDNDGTSGADGDTDDLFTLRQINLYNNGDSTGVQDFQIEVRTVANPAWSPVLFSGSSTISALRNWNQQIFIPDTPIVDVIEFRLHTINNYGHSLTRIREIEAIGDAIGASHTFIAQRIWGQQIYTLDTPVVDITEMRFRTIDNYGHSLTRIREIEAIGDAIGPSHTFIAQRSWNLQTYVLDVAVDNVTDVRFHTIDNYGHSLTRAREFGVSGTSSGPAYVFNALRNSTEQTYNFNRATGRLFRLHTFDNYGHSITRTRSISLESTNCHTPVGHWRMEEASWGSVNDSANSNNGTAFNGANTVGSSCRYGQFDGVDDYVQIPHDAALNGSDALTYVAYIRPDSWSGTDQIMAKSVHGGGSGRVQMGIFSESGVFKGRAETAGGRFEVQAPLPATAGDWIQVALVFDSTSLTLYQDGVSVATTSFAATTLNQNTDPLNISKRVGTNQYYFHGLIDDVRVYTTAFSAADILDLYNTVTPCSLTPTLDHIEISHDGSALICNAETLTIRACTDASCTSVATSDVVVSLDATGGTSSWSSNPVTIPADSSSGVDITLTHRTAETITLSASSLPAASNALVCSPVGCNIT
ncbi:MAG: LamG domain-containing protein, partial [Gammaproteobacteria bacterium]|nr:LamG domain-containing protein [Gammaproteobacteria bacterium]